MPYKVKTEAHEATNHKCGLLWKPWVYVKRFYLPYDGMSIICKRHIHQIEVNKVNIYPSFMVIYVFEMIKETDNFSALHLSTMKEKYGCGNNSIEILCGHWMLSILFSEFSICKHWCSKILWHYKFNSSKHLYLMWCSN